MVVFQKASKCQCGIGIISMLISLHIHNAAICAIAKKTAEKEFEDLKFSFLENNRGQ